ncbi:hypothetical protein pb186bvf_010457 [Paramecium bursaria]
MNIFSCSQILYHLTNIHYSLLMILLYFILGLSCQQELNLAVSDLQDPLTVSGWDVSKNGVVNQYQTTIVKCNQNLLLLNPQPNKYQKTFTLTDQEYDTLYLELDAYFLIFSESKIIIYINSNLVFKQKFATNYMLQNGICGNSDSYYTIHQKFQTQSVSLKLEIKFVTANANSQLGIRNLNIYTNGYKLSNGCNLDSPFLQGSSCVEFCSNNNAYLGGDDMLVCQTGTAGQSRLIGQYLVSQPLIWKFTNPSPSISEQYYLTPIDFFLQIDNIYNPISYNIMYSGLFTSAFISPYQYYYQITQPIQITHKLQISFVFYILGDWDVYLQLIIRMDHKWGYIQKVLIFIEIMWQEYPSKWENTILPQEAAFIGLKLFLPGNPTITVTRTLITFQANFYSSLLQIGFSQQLYGSTAKYGFGNVYIYELFNDPNIYLSGLYGIPYKCKANYYAYNGQCVQNCPLYSILDQTNKNCTDYSQTQSKIYQNTQTQNYFGTYIVKEFYNNNFQLGYYQQFILSNIKPIQQLFKWTTLFIHRKQKNIRRLQFLGLGYLFDENLIYLYIIRSDYNLHLYLIDSWQGGDTFSYYLDGILGSSYIQNTPNIQLQGLSNLDQQIVVNQKLTHTKSTLTLLFICAIALKNSMIGSCGISDLFVLIDKTTNDILCPSITQYFSYFTNNCENCLPTSPGCQLYPDYLPVTPIKCSIGCIICQSSSICNLCDTDSGYQTSGNICSCQSGYVQQTTCNKCHYSCQECSGASKWQCTSCVGTRAYQQGLCQCQAGKVDVFSQSQCELIHDQTTGYCHYSCYTCFGPSYFHCITCPPGSFRVFKDFSSCPCTSQYYDTGLNQCEQITCDDSCFTCDGPLESDCLICPNNFRFVSGYCICDGLYNNIVSSQSCILNSSSCYFSCLTCFNITPLGCLSCDIHRFLNINALTNQQFCTCFDGYFEVSQNCYICDQTCLTCSNSSTNCNSCRETDNRGIDYLNQCICLAGYNDKLNPGQSCVQDLIVCHYSCIICFGLQSNQCLDCDPTYRVLNNTTCDCQAFQYDAGSLQCQACFQTCLTCNGTLINNCLTCDSSLNRILQSNQCICNVGYNDKLITYSCEQDMTNCDQTCLKCFGIGQDQCLTCPSDRNLQGNFCICKSIYYEQLSICYLCDPTCLTCSDSGPNNCNSCDIQIFRQIIDNQCNCVSGYVDNGNPICQVCPGDCQDCDLDSNCISCKIDKSFVNDLGRCECIDGYLMHNLQCLNCHYSCSKCNGLLNSQCTQCDALQFRSLTVSVCQCFDGYQENDSGNQIFSCQYKNAQDGVWTYGEQCDDANNDPRDGCDNFQITSGYSCTNIFNQPSICYKCPENCLNVNNQKIKLLASLVHNNITMLNPNEDSCLECPTPSYCSVCINQQIPKQGKCDNCGYGYYYQENQCRSRCGDGIKTIDEQCDDGNVQSSDGCSEQCQIENDFVCQTISNNSICFIHEQPYLIYEIPQQQINDQKRIIITASQNVTYGDILIELIGQPNIQKQHTVTGNEKLIIDLKLNFNQSYESITINLLINGVIVNQYNQGLKNNKIQITLTDIIVLDEQQQQTAQQLSQVGKGVVIGLFCMSTTTIFMAGISQFISFMNLVQQLQFIQYINIKFPPHFMQFLTIFNGFTVAPVIEIFSIKQKLTQLDPQQQVFLSNGMNAYYLANMQGFFISSLILLMFYVWLKLLLFAIQKIKDFMLRRQIIKLNVYTIFKQILNLTLEDISFDQN